MTTSKSTQPIPEIFMRVIDPKRIRKLMAIQDVSARRLAEDIGYASHSYINRILAGEIKTVTPERAARIAHRLGVGIDDLFMAKTSSDGRQNDKRQGAA